RDMHTAKIAIQASLTGHTVFATLHTKNTIGAIYRLLDLDISLLNIEQVLRAVVTQQLVRVYCPYCEEECNIHCNRRKRLGIFEILEKGDLEKVFQEIQGKKVTHQYPTLQNI